MNLMVASYVSVFVKAFQQRNVAFNNYTLVPIFSLAMAFTEVYIIVSIVNLGVGLNVVLELAFGAVLGCWTAMYMHNKITKVKKEFLEIGKI